MAKAADEEHAFLYVMRVLMVSFLKGTAPIMAVEVARRAVPGHVRPSFKELEQACRGGGLQQQQPPQLGRVLRQPGIMEKTRPIIILKKKGGHSGHHGGAWKVAYADFVTAMMALFIVLWLLNSSKQIQEAVGGYFKDPTGTSKKVGSNMVGSGDAFQLAKQDMPKLKEELQKAIRRVDKFEKLKNQIEMTITSEGLRIELLETEAGTFFDSGNASPSLNGKDLLVTLAEELG